VLPRPTGACLTVAQVLQTITGWRYREPTASAYRRDLRCFWQWCADRGLAPLAAKRPHIELYLRDLERRGYAPATISRRLPTLAGLFKYAVIDEHVPANPTRR
jgi:integrase/recombinase XerD